MAGRDTCSGLLHRGEVIADELAGSELGVVTATSWPPGLQELLTSLQPQRAARHGSGSSRTAASRRYIWHKPDVVRERLGFTMPTLSVLREQGLRERFATIAGDEQVKRLAELRRGESAAVRVLYVPAEQTLGLPLEEAARGVTATLTMTYGYRASLPVEQPRTVRLTATGDYTVVDVGGQLVGVQHLLQDRTRLSWRLVRPEASYDVAVSLSCTPMQAVGTLAACDLFGAGEDEPTW